MKAKTKKPSARSLGADHVLGQRTFAAISAVEGVGLTAAGRKRLADMKKRKLSADQQRSEVISAYARAPKPSR